jgi:hypothetical protein
MKIIFKKTISKIFKIIREFIIFILVLLALSGLLTIWGIMIILGWMFLNFIL